jgi:hypothetical protein
MSQDPRPFEPISTAGVLQAKQKQAKDDSSGSFVVLLDFEKGVFRVTPPQRERLARRLRSFGWQDLKCVNPDEHPDVFDELDVEDSTPQLLLFWKQELQSPVWLVNPQEPNISGWIAALQERGGLPSSQATQPMTADMSPASPVDPGVRASTPG